MKGGRAMAAELAQPAVGWFSLSLIISGIAQALGRDGFGWWLFGIFTGPLALFCLVLAGRLDETEEGR